MVPERVSLSEPLGDGDGKASSDTDSPARDEQSLVCEDIPVWKHLANSLVPAPLTPVAPVFLLMGAFLPPAGRDVAPGRDVAAEEVQQ